jgi:mannosyltransferase OCH1-like enzyme
MRKIFILFFPIVIVSGLCWLLLRSNDPSLHLKALSKHAFDRTLGIKEFGKTFILHRSLDRDIRRKARQLIEKRKSEWKPGNISSIPLIIHQFWLSDDPLPDDLARAAQLVQQQHQGFRYTLWRSCDVKDILQNILGPTYDALPLIVLRDLAAAAVLWQYGGVVVDLEAECVHPITSLLPLGDCLIGFEPPLAKTKGRRRLFLSSSVIAAIPSHPIIHSYLTEMVHRIETCAKKNTFDSQWITQDSLTAVVSIIPLEQGRPLLLGPKYFCPVCPEHIHHLKKILNCESRRNSFQKALQTLHITSILPYSDISRETIFVHMAGGRMSKPFSSKSKIIDFEQKIEPTAKD